MNNLFSKNSHSDRENTGGGLPRPAISSASIHSSQRITKLAESRWKAIKDAIKTGTGYSTKQPEWSSSLVDVSDQATSSGDDPDGALEADELEWISDQNGEENLSLILVEREVLAASHMSPGPTASQENLTTSHDAAQHNRTRLANDHTYRLKGYEASISDTEIGTLTPLSWVRYRLFAWVRRAFLRYCYPEFNDPQVEQVYSNRVYESQKFLAFVCSSWLLISWAIALTFLTNKALIYDVIFFYCVAPVLTVPLPVMIFYNLPKRFPIFYQCFLVVSIWSWSAYIIIFMQLCSYYGGSHQYFSCGGRDMMNLFYYMIAFPVIALFGLGQQRIYATIVPLVMIIVPAVLFTPRHTVWVRFAIEHLFLQALLLYIHWRREILERNVYFFNKKTRDALIALHHTRTAQARVEAARARVTGYIFHEVRQPLNAAFLAYQNLAASTVIKPDQRLEWDTLRIKLASMSKLLNDVLDQKRMDAGKFEIVSRPYDFHQMIRQGVISCRMEAERKRQEITIELDKTIDRTAVSGTFRAQRRSDEEVFKLMAAMPDEHGIVMGDETRVTQVLTNLISNASKFTPKKGKIRIVTKLVPPRSVPPTPLSMKASQSFSGQPLLTPPEGSTGASPVSLNPSSRWNDTGDRLIVRIEVTDNGVGISPVDVRERRLFSPFAQAGVGRLQGGSGSGLGLSLVRRMVKLMGGRMGVESVVNKGTTFWVELPLNFASEPPSVDTMLPPALVSSPMGSYTSTGTTLDPSTLASPVSLRSNTESSVTMPNRSGTNESSQSTKPGPSNLGAGLSVLIVDDDAVMRGLLRRLLLRHGCSVEGAENGQVGLRKLGAAPSIDVEESTDFSESTESTPRAEDDQVPPTSRRYDIVFLDNQMPVLSGLEMVSALRKAGRRDFVVGLSGEAAAIDQERFRQAGANEVLTKPVLESQIKAILQKARERSASSNNAPSIRVHQPP